MCLARVFGIGSAPAPVIKKVAPGATTVTNGDIGADTMAESEMAARKKKKQGFAATRLADTASMGTTGGKTTLG